jgi:hypothetical protein
MHRRQPRTSTCITTQLLIGHKLLDEHVPMKTKKSTSARTANAVDKYIAARTRERRHALHASQEQFGKQPSVSFQ